jgi:proline dehydrogenase
VLSRSVLLTLANSKAMENIVRKNALSTRIASRFVAGDTVEDVTAPVRALNAQGLTATLDLLGESVTSEQEVAVTVDTYLRLFQHIRAENLNSNVSLKLTALGIDISEEMAYRNMERLLDAAGSDQFIRIDMESSDYTQRTLDLFSRLWNSPAAYRNGVVIQSYLHRSADDIANLNAMGARVRLCKGAYKEPPTVAFPDKADVDANYVALMKQLLQKGNYPGLATHDARIIDTAKTFIKQNEIGTDRFEFQMLYGIRRDLQTALVKQGYRMRVYVPFGTHWYPYFMRRLAERPANVGFVLKNLLRGK